MFSKTMYCISIDKACPKFNFIYNEQRLKKYYTHTNIYVITYSL